MGSTTDSELNILLGQKLLLKSVFVVLQLQNYTFFL